MAGGRSPAGGGWRVARRPVGHHQPVTSRAELSSLASTLDEVTRRVTALADQARADTDDELAAELYGVERALTGALRRLRRLEPPVR